MSAEAEQAPQMPPIIEGPGRYAVYQSPDGGWVIARAGELCDRCKECGCGEQAEPVAIPAMALKLAESFSGQGGKGKLMAMLKAAGKR